MRSGVDVIQAVVFTSFLNLSDKLGLAQKLKNLRSVTFDLDPNILSLPETAPVELPRIIMKTQDDSISLNVSPARTDLFIKGGSLDDQGIPKTQLSELKTQVVDITKEIAGLLKERFSAHINRAALVTNYIVKLEESSKDFLLDNYFKKDVLKKADEMQLNFLYKKELGKIKINEWFRFNTLRRVDDPTNDTAFMMTIDVNSLAEIDYNFSEEILIKFLQSCFTLTEEELKLFSRGKIYG